MVRAGAGFSLLIPTHYVQLWQDRTMQRTESPTAVVPIWVVLREDGGPREYLADVDREPGPGEWGCRVTWHVTRTSARVGAVELAAPDPEAVGPTTWRWVRLGEVIQASREVLAIAGHVGQLSPETREAGQVLAAIAGGRDRSGYTPEHFTAVAEAYNKAVNLGDRFPVRATRQALTEEMGWEPTDATVRGWVAASKRRGLITTTSRPSRAGTRGKGQGNANH